MIIHNIFHSTFSLATERVNALKTGTAQKLLKLLHMRDHPQIVTCARGEIIATLFQ